MTYEEEARWCEIHKSWGSPWRYEDQIQQEICPKCYKDYWDKENEELWGEDA